MCASSLVPLQWLGPVWQVRPVWQTDGQAGSRQAKWSRPDADARPDRPLPLPRQCPSAHSAASLSARQAPPESHSPARGKPTARINCQCVHRLFPSPDCLWSASSPGGLRASWGLTEGSLSCGREESPTIEHGGEGGAGDARRAATERQEIGALDARCRWHCRPWEKPKSPDASPDSSPGWRVAAVKRGNSNGASRLPLHFFEALAFRVALSACVCLLTLSLSALCMSALSSPGSFHSPLPPLSRSCLPLFPPRLPCAASFPATSPPVPAPPAATPPSYPIRTLPALPRGAFNANCGNCSSRTCRASVKKTHQHKPRARRTASLDPQPAAPHVDPVFIIPSAPLALDSDSTHLVPLLPLSLLSFEISHPSPTLLSIHSFFSLGLPGRPSLDAP